MKIGIMQPYFFPYIGYWQLIHAVDVFVVYDDGKLITNGWIHRNRILDFDGRTPRYIALPLRKKSVCRTIADMERADDPRALQQLVKTIETRYRRAPHYEEAIGLLRPLLMNPEPNLARYLTHSLQAVCGYLDIPTRFVLSSTIDKSGLEHVEDKAARICRTLGISHYVNPIGGKELYAREEWAKRGLTLDFLRRRDTIRYPQFGGPFVPDLSLIDMLMFCSREEIRQFLDEYDLL